MAKTLYDVQQEYEQYKALNPQTKVDLTSFAKQMDAVSGVPERESAYDPKWYNKLNALIDTGFESTGLPSVTKAVGGGLGELVDSALDTNIKPTLEAVGRDTPRMIAEGIATIPEVGSGVGIPAAIATWGNRLRKIAGYGSAAVRGYDETNSPLGAAISAGSMFGANKLLSPVERGGIDVGGKAKSAIEKWLAPELVSGAELAASTTAEKFLPAAAQIGTDVAAATGINEVTRQAQMSVGPDAVGITDPQRNPFTAENIAGNVAGAAFFTPQIVSALRSQPRVSPGQVKQLHDFVTSKENALREVQGMEPLPETPEAAPELRSRHEALYGIIRSSLDAAGEFDKIGKTEDAVRARTNALDAINEAAAGRYSPMPEDLIAQIRTAVDEEVRFQPPTDPEKFQGFVNEVRSIVDTLNEGRLKYSSELAQREETLNRNDKKAVKEFEEWKASMEANKGKSWHPEARASQVVDRLWQSGDLQPLTPEWLEKEYNATFDTSGNPQFATRVVAQKVANYALDHVDAALTAERATRKADPMTGEQLDPKKAAVVKKYNDLDMQFAEALSQVPPELRDAIVRRSVEFRRQETTKAWGETHSRYAPWQQAVVRAVRSYDPASGTALLRQRNKGYQRTTLDTLVRKDANGKYVWEPNERPIPSALGGKGSTGEVRDPLTGKRTKMYEQNIEGLPTKQGQENLGGLDEEEFKAALANTSQESVRAGDFGTIHLEGEQASPIDMPAEPTASENALGDRMAKASKQVNAVLDSLTDEQAWSLARSEFKLRSQLIPDVRAGNIKLALKAAFETLRARDTDTIGPNAKAFLDAEIARGVKPLEKASPVRQAKLFLREYFQTKEFFPGSDAKMEPHVERVARVVKKLMDPEAVKRAKTEFKAQGGEGLDRTIGDIQNYLRGDASAPEPTGEFPDKVRRLAPDSPVSYGTLTGFPEEPRARVGVTVLLEPKQVASFIKDANDQNLVANRVRSADVDEKGRNVTDRWVVDSAPISDGLQTVFVYPENRLTADIAEYNRLQAELKRIGYDKVGTPEFNEVWQKSEDVKNRHGGYVPGTRPKAQGEVAPDVTPATMIALARELDPELFAKKVETAKKFITAEAAKGMPLSPQLQGDQITLAARSVLEMNVKDPRAAKLLEAEARLPRLGAKSQGEATSSPGMVANSPKPGAFVPDVHRTMHAWVDKTLGRAGYSGSTREFLTEVAVALAKQMPDLDFYRLVGPEQGVAGSATAGSPRGKVGLNIDRPVTPGQEFKAAQQLLQTLAHEITHMDGYIRDGLVPRPDAYSDERARVHENMQHLAANLSDDERMVMLQVMNESIPEQFRSPLRQADGRPYGTSNPDEFVAEMTSKVIMMLANDTARGRAAAMEALDYGPPEVREMAQNTFRMIGDTLGAMRDAVAKGERLTGKTDPFILSKGFEAIVDSAHVMTEMREADYQLAIAREMVGNLDRGAGSPPARMTDAVWFRGQKELEKYQKDVPTVSQTALEGINDVQDSVFSAKAYDKKFTPNAFAQWLYPFTNLMTAMERQGVNLARPVLEQVMSLEPGISRLYSSMMRGFLKQNTDGSYDFNAEHPLVRKVSEEKSGPWRDAVNKVSAWQQTNRTQPMFVKDAQGVVIVNPDPKLKAQAKWDSIRSQLSPSDQQYVMNISVALDESNQLAAGHLITHLQETNVNHIATYLMAANKRMAYDQAQALAKRAHDAFLAGKVSSLQGTIPPKQLQALQRLLVGAQSEAAPLGNGLLAKFVEVKNLLENRPGFRSEALPHDWIVKYDDNGSTKFDSRPTEEQARYLANRLTAQGKRVMGEIINKKDVRAPQEFDAPDALLARVAETENFVWQNFIADMEQQHGAEIAESLREGYTPVGQSIKDMGVSGLNKFLRERRALVDREAFDYIDGTMGYLQRMSASLAIRGMQQNVRLILNDPRARFLPTFRKMVTEHVSEMLTPQSDFARKAKAFTTTYFIGANLASAAVNSTQSVSTLVPWLINGVDPRYKTSGGPVKAWKQMFQAMGTATDYSINTDWQKTAASAKAIDPRAQSLDQALATSYRRHIENGGIQQTVIDDLVYGRDQRMLMNAKFGHGDYGPVPLSSMVTDKLYLASQLMLSLYKGVEHFNAKTAFLAGVRQGYELGLRGDELYQYGTKMQSLATFGGGRANAPGLVPKLSTQYTRSAVGLVNSLQQYGYGMVATYAQLAKDSIGRSKGLNAAQIRQAQKAFGTMLMTQTAVAGALGLPFVGATLTLLEKVFGIPANQAVRQGLASLSEDDETGAVIAETALNGFPNQWTGLDLSSRLGTSSLLGTSSYRGFDLKDMVGPVGSIVSNSAEALNMFGQGKPMQGFRNLVPAAFKNVVELSDTKAKYGDYGLRDKSGNLLYTPTAGKAVGYALGFRPRELSQRRQLQSMLSASNERVQNKRDRELDRAAQALLQGDPTVAQRLAQDARAGDATVDPKEILRQVSDRAVAATNERDLLATGSKWNEGERLDIARSFGENVNPRQSEVSLQQQRMTLARMLGDPQLAPTMDSMRQAVMVDQLVKQRGMPRSQAIRLVEFLDGVPPGGL